jgi:hypothetical protein
LEFSRIFLGDFLVLVWIHLFSLDAAIDDHDMQLQLEGLFVEYTSHLALSFHRTAQVFLSAKCSQSLSLNSFCGLKSVGASASSYSLFRGHSLSLFQRHAVVVRDLETVAPGQARAAAYKVAVLGAAGGIGQPLSLLIKMSPLVSDLNLYDIANVKGVVADLSHCNTPAKVCSVYLSTKWFCQLKLKKDITTLIRGNSFFLILLYGVSCLIQCLDLRSLKLSFLRFSQFFS